MNQVAAVVRICILDLIALGSVPFAFGSVAFCIRLIGLTLRSAARCTNLEIEQKTSCAARPLERDVRPSLICQYKNKNGFLHLVLLFSARSLRKLKKPSQFRPAAAYLNKLARLPSHIYRRCDGRVSS